MKNLLRAVLLVTLSAALVLGSPVGSAASDPPGGTLTFAVGGRLLGTEVFRYEADGDSLIVNSEMYQTMHSDAGSDTIHKRLTMSVDAASLSFRRYQSVHDARGHRLTRSLVVRDSTISSFQEYDQRGEAVILPLPPGRLFVLDGGMFVLFDIMCHSLAGSSFASRPLNLVALGRQDTVIEARVVDRGLDTLRWGGRPLQARHLEFTDGTIRYQAWAAPDGRLLRLTQPEMQVSVDRTAPAVKPRAPRPRPR